MSEEITEVTETFQNVQDLYRKVSSYLVQARKKPSDTNVEVKDLKVNVGKKGKEYDLSMEIDFSLTPKNPPEKSKDEKTT